MTTQQRARQHFEELSADERRQAVRDMATLHSVHTIAAATGLSVEAVRHILSERPAQ